jgi:hypothetical protein
MSRTRRALLAIAAGACAGALACGVARRTGGRDGGDAAAWVTAAPTASAAPVAAPRVPCALGVVGADGATALERAVRDAMAAARFDEVIDLGPTEDGACGDAGRCEPAPIAHRPSVDVAVIAFPSGCPPVLANAMLSRDLPLRRSTFDPVTLAVKGVRYRRWDQARWDAPGVATDPPLGAADDLVPPPAGASVDFVVPYPASNFKLMVAVGVLRLVDGGSLRLDEPIVFGARTRPLHEWLADMITWSDDESTQALLKRLHAVGEAARLDAVFARLGLSTLQLHDTSAKTGRNWHPGRIHMSAWDTARLLWLLDADAPAPTWRAPGGAVVDGGFLSAASKRRLLGLLGEQAYHDVLDTPALCGAPRTERGIPARVPDRWIGEDGRVRVEGGAPTADVRPCNADAEVTFAHKTGLTLNFGSDAGIVRGLPGRAQRHYIITFFSNLGYRYTDADKASGARPCRDLGICYPQRIAAMAAAIDGVIAAAIEAPPGAGAAPAR